MKPRRPGSRRLSLEPLEPRAFLSVVPMITGMIGTRARPPLSTAAETGSLTLLGAARRSFFAAYRTTYYIGPPLQTDQSAQVFMKGGGTSSYFLHGNLELAFYPPTGPTGTTTGQAALIGKSVSNTGDLLGVDLSGQVGPIVPGRVITLNWTANGSGGGTFTNASGSGTVQIRLNPGKVVPGNGSGGAGEADVIFRGTVATAGVYDITRV